MLTLEFDPGDIDKQLDWLSKSMGVSVHDLVIDQMRLYSIDMRRRTQPTRGMFGGAVVAGKQIGGEKSGARKLGERRVSLDLNKLFVGMDSREMAAVREMGGDHVAKYRFKSKKGAVWLVDASFYMTSASQSQMRKFHQRHRSRTTGRVTTAGSRDRKIGRWKAVRKMHVPMAQKRKYVQDQKDQVGRLKGGWNKAVEHYGQLAGKPQSTPRWIKRHGTREGIVGGRIDRRGRGDLFAANKVPYAGYKIPGSTVRAAHRTRQRDITKNMIKRADQIIKRFNQAGRKAA